LRQIFDKQKKLERELESLRSKAAGSATADLAASAKNVDGIRVVSARLEGLDAKALRDSVDQLKQQLVDCIVLLASAADGRVSLVAGVHGSAMGRIKAGDVVAHIAAQIEGKGGGRPDMAQGGGNDSPQLPVLLAGLPDWIGARLSSAKA
jgi:alanyl-tRNA synthetase